MKKLLLLLAIILAIHTSFSQHKYKKPFFTGSLNTTFAINENYTLDTDDGEMLLEPASVLLRLGVGYQLHRRWQVGINAGFDHHFRFGINAIPFYGSLRFNITEDEDDTFFAEYSHGKMWRPSVKYEDGNYYGFGIGSQITSSSRWSTIVRLDYHRKAISDFENGHLDSISIGIGFSFF